MKEILGDAYNYLEAENGNQAIQMIGENNNIMIRIMSNILGSRNSESREHILHIKTATEMMLRQLVKVTDAYPLTEADIALITTASSLHDIGKIRIPEE